MRSIVKLLTLPAILVISLAAGIAFAHSTGETTTNFRFADLQLPASDGSFNNPPAPSPLKEFLGEMLMALGGALLIALKVGLAYLISYLKQRGKDSKLFNALAMASELVQTYVAKAEVELKPMFAKALEDGAISPEEGAALKAKVIEIIKRDMPADVWATVAGALGPAVDGWLSGKVEQAVSSQKVAANPVGP